MANYQKPAFTFILMENDTDILVQSGETETNTYELDKPNAPFSLYEDKTQTII